LSETDFGRTENRFLMAPDPTADCYKIAENL